MYLLIEKHNWIEKKPGSSDFGKKWEMPNKKNFTMNKVKYQTRNKIAHPRNYNFEKRKEKETEV